MFRLQYWLKMYVNLNAVCNPSFNRYMHFNYYYRTKMWWVNDSSQQRTACWAMPLEVKAIAEVPSWAPCEVDRLSKNPENAIERGRQHRLWHHVWYQNQSYAWNSVYEGSVRVERMGADTPLIKNKTEETQCRCGLHQETVQTRSTTRIAEETRRKFAWAVAPKGLVPKDYDMTWLYVYI